SSCNLTPYTKLFRSKEGAVAAATAASARGGRTAAAAAPMSEVFKNSRRVQKCMCALLPRRRTLRLRHHHHRTIPAAIQLEMIVADEVDHLRAGHQHRAVAVQVVGRGAVIVVDEI